MCFKGEKYFKEKNSTDHCKLVAFPDGTLFVSLMKGQQEKLLCPQCICNAIQKIALELDSSVGNPHISSLTLSF